LLRVFFSRVWTFCVNDFIWAAPCTLFPRNLKNTNYTYSSIKGIRQYVYRHVCSASAARGSVSFLCNICFCMCTAPIFVMFIVLHSEYIVLLAFSHAEVQGRYTLRTLLSTLYIFFASHSKVTLICVCCPNEICSKDSI